jgi:putative methionine-R-sulfoxide reductase with GAF domain
MTPQGTASQPVPDPGDNSATSKNPDGTGQDYLSTLLDALADKISADGESLDSVLERIAIAAQSFTGASGAAIALRENGDVVCRARSGDSAPPLGTQLDANSGISGECLRTGEPILVEDTEADPRVDAEVCRSLDLRSVALVAISRDGIADGVLEVFSTQPEAFDANHVTALQQLARLVLKATTPAAAAISTPEEPTVHPGSTGHPVAAPTLPPVRVTPAVPPAARAQEAISSPPVQKPEKKILSPVAAPPPKPAAAEKPAPVKARAQQVEPQEETVAATATPAAAKPATAPQDLPAPQFKATEIGSGGNAFFAALKAAWLRPLPIAVLLILVTLGVVYYLFYRG